MTHIAIELPEEIANRLGEPNDLSRVALEALAAQGYRSDKLTESHPAPVSMPYPRAWSFGRPK
jgi:hypothetical protein